MSHTLVPSGSLLLFSHTLKLIGSLLFAFCMLVGSFFFAYCMLIGVCRFLSVFRDVGQTGSSALGGTAFHPSSIAEGMGSGALRGAPGQVKS